MNLKYLNCSFENKCLALIEMEILCKGIAFFPDIRKRPTEALVMALEKSSLLKSIAMDSRNMLRKITIFIRQKIKKI